MGKGSGRRHETREGRKAYDKNIQDIKPADKPAGEVIKKKPGVTRIVYK